MSLIEKLPKEILFDEVLPHLSNTEILNLKFSNKNLYKKINLKKLNFFLDGYNWYCISRHENLSAHFAKKFRDRIHVATLLLHQNYPNNFYAELKNLLQKDINKKKKICN